MMADGHFVIELTDGTVFEFEGTIDYTTNDKYLVCKRLNNINVYYVIAIIPHTSVFSILREEFRLTE